MDGWNIYGDSGEMQKFSFKFLVWIFQLEIFQSKTRLSHCIAIVTFDLNMNGNNLSDCVYYTHCHSAGILNMGIGSLRFIKSMPH